VAKKISQAEVWKTLRRFYGYIFPYGWQLALILLLLIGFSVLQLLNPKIFGRVIDLAAHPENPGNWHRIVVLLVWFAIVQIVRTIVLLARNFLMQRVGMRVTCDMRIAVFSHLQKLSLRFYEGRHTGKIVSRVTEDTASAHQLVTGASVNLLGDLLTIVFVLVVLVRQNLSLALVTYAILPFFIVNYLWHRRRMRFESRRHRRNWDKVVSFLNERISSNRLVKAFAAESREIDSFRGRIEDDYLHYNQVVWRNTLLSTGAELLTGFGTLAVLAYGSWLAFGHHGGFTVGDLVAFWMYLTYLYAPIIRLVESSAVIQRAVVALEKIFVLLDTQPHIPDNDQKPSLPRLAGRIEFQAVSFAYRPGQEIIRNVDFTVASGALIALVGPSGGGKSTLISLLARFYDPTGGRILVDCLDIAAHNSHSLRSQIGIVMQDNILFSGTIAENLKYGRVDATEAEMIEAAKAANAHEFIAKLPQGYRSAVGERGVQLSGGQRQRLAIARVLLKDPRILIFDEATSALDTHSERLIQQATERVMKGRTSLVIAHRLSTVVNADQIIVLRGGAIIERGTHAQLLAQGGLYRELYQLQFASAAPA